MKQIFHRFRILHGLMIGFQYLASISGAVPRVIVFLTKIIAVRITFPNLPTSTGGSFVGSIYKPMVAGVQRILYNIPTTFLFRCYYYFFNGLFNEPIERSGGYRTVNTYHSCNMCHVSGIRTRALGVSSSVVRLVIIPDGFVQSLRLNDRLTASIDSFTRYV